MNRYSKHCSQEIKKNSFDERVQYVVLCPDEKDVK